MKKFKKMSLDLATKELSRNELKGIMAGSGNEPGFYKCCNFIGQCSTCTYGGWDLYCDPSQGTILTKC